ncbi:MAG: TonB-dependent receptor [Alphaproteobacteria bacterium]|nr:TonB-dependent receptor [Alphaproteobacteria bacterium]MBU2270359.1 TonB-dependent receptor [Alphaproteobacteria bacterium]MBU2417173.1 TonB-dependent receptor [Alphaproteobacteria bacterium]
MRHFRRGAAAAILLVLPGVARADETPTSARKPDNAARQLAGGLQDDQDLTRLSLEELSMVEITSVSRRPEALADAASAIFVISAEDIRRSGATSLPEVLRLAPNLNVQRVNAVDYAISARGFNGYETSNKLLVLIDGRSIYSTLSSGVFWDAHDVMLQNIERIEVISGPGGALYGSNAMNGVINIITRSAADTKGTLVSVGAGSEEVAWALRHGGDMGESGAWRVWLNGHMRDESRALTGEGANDDAEGMRAGARADWVIGENRLALRGNIFDNQVTINEDLLGTETQVRGGNVLGQWVRPLAGGELQVQTYFDRYEREEPGSLEESDTWDVSVQHAVDFGRHRLVLGAGHRIVDSRFTAPPGGAFLDPAERTLTLTNVFVQDQISLREGLTLTLGAKLEDNSFSGEQFLPNVRLAWQRPGGDLLWGAISRASRTPNRIERDLTLPGFLVGADFQSERLTAWELGYRANPSPKLSFSINAFYNAYDDLRTVSITPVTFLPLNLSNNGEATTWGVDAWTSYDVSPSWRLSAGVSTLTKDYDATPTTDDVSGLVSIGDDPDYQVLLRSQHDLTEALELDLRLRAVDDLAAIDGYVEADARLGWRVTDRLELSLTGRNLIEGRHVETGDALRSRAFGRSVFGALQVRF